MTVSLTSPLDPQVIATLNAGDRVLLSGVVFTARDAAHRRFCEALAAGESLPVDLHGQTIFYAGPTPTPPNRVSGAIGPTTSVRMDPFTPQLLHYGVRALIGKGDRGEAVRAAIRENRAVYFTAIGGCAAYLASCIESLTVLAYDDLGTESVKRLTIRDLPLTVAIDAQGNDYYETARKEYFESL
jgi:fumarate hydratase subunit beta